MDVTGTRLLSPIYARGHKDTTMSKSFAKRDTTPDSLKARPRTSPINRSVIRPRSDGGTNPNNSTPPPLDARHPQRKGDPGWDNFVSGVLAKNQRWLQTRRTGVSTVGDRFEAEADRVAEEVVNTPHQPGSAVRNLHGELPSVPKAGQRIQTKLSPIAAADTPAGGSEGISAIVDNALSSGGTAIPVDTRRNFEERIGSDFSNVRIYTGPAAANSAAALNARAYTVGNNIAFAAGEYRPHEREGQKLIAHELAHVVQQSGSTGTVQRKERDDVAGMHPVAHPHRGGFEFLIDGDGDQHKELRVNVTDGSELTPADQVPKNYTPPATLDHILFRMYQRSTGAMQVRTVNLPTPLARKDFSPYVEEVTDGRRPTTIVLSATVPAATRIEIFPPTIVDEQRAYLVRIGGAGGPRAYYSYPRETQAAATIGRSAGPEQTVGAYGTQDIAIGAYGDRFRITADSYSWTDNESKQRFSRGVRVGIAGLNGTQIVGTHGVNLTFNDDTYASTNPDLLQPAGVSIVSNSRVGLYLDVNHDGIADVRIFDRIDTDPRDQNASPQKKRFHTLRIERLKNESGKESYTTLGIARYTVIDGVISSDDAANSPLDRYVASNTLAVQGLAEQEGATFSSAMAAAETDVINIRHEAISMGLLSQTAYDAWASLMSDMDLLRRQISSNVVDPITKERAAVHAQRYFEVMKAETKGHETVTSYGKSDGVIINPYIDEWTTIGIISNTYGAGPELPSKIRSANWEEALRDYETLTKGIDKWILDQLKNAKKNEANARVAFPPNVDPAQMREKFAKNKWVRQDTYEAWLAFSTSMTALQNRQTPTGGLRGAIDNAQRTFRTFYRLFSDETKGSIKRIYGKYASWESNPYTGEESTHGLIGESTGPGIRFPKNLKTGNLGEAVADYRALAAGYDRWLAYRYLEEMKSNDQRAIARVEYAGAMRTELAAIEKFDPIFIPAVFHPDDKFKDKEGFTEQVPMRFYSYWDGDTCYLVNLTNPTEKYHKSTSTSDRKYKIPRSLWEDLNDSVHFPEGRLHYSVSGDYAGSVQMTDHLTWEKFFTYVSLGLLAVGAVLLAIGSMGSLSGVSAVGFWAIAGSGLAGGAAATANFISHLNDGDLDAATAILDITQVVSALAGISALGLGRVSLMARTAAGKGANWTGNMAKFAVFADRMFVPMRVTQAAADVVSVATFSVSTAQQLDEIENGPGTRSEKDLAKARLIAQLAFTGGVTVLSIKGTLAELRTGRTLQLYYPDLLDNGQRGGVPTANVAGDVDLADLYVSQENVRKTTRDGVTLEEVSESMRADGWKGDPIDVVEWPEGIVTSFDNRRPVAANAADLKKVPVLYHHPDEPFSAIRAEAKESRLKADLYQLPDGSFVREAEGATLVYNKGTSPKTWGEAMIFRTANQDPFKSGALQGQQFPIKFGTKQLPRVRK